MKARVATAALIVSWAAGPSPAAHAGGAALSGLIDARWDHALSDGGPYDEAFSAGVRARAFLGETLGYCLGADARAGAAGGGALYAAEAYLAGVSWRISPGTHLALCAGAGVAGISGGALPRAWTFPAELHFETEGAFGVVRPLLYLRAAKVVGAEARTDGSPLLPPADELSAGVGIRVTIPSQPAPRLVSADGIWLGITYGEVTGVRTLGLSLGYGAYASH